MGELRIIVKNKGNVLFFFEYAGHHAVFRSVLPNFEPDCPKVHPVFV